MHNIRFFSTKRYVNDGHTLGNYENFNLALHTGDTPEQVIKNRALLQHLYDLPNEPLWLNQTHSTKCIMDGDRSIDGDAAITQEVGKVLAVFTADCLPIFAFDNNHTTVGIAHAGWQGLHDGVIDNFIDGFSKLGIDPNNLIIHFGTALGQMHFEVDSAFVERFTHKHDRYREAFISAINHTPLTADTPIDSSAKCLFNIYQAAQINLELLGMLQQAILPSEREENECTYKSAELFSYRRDGQNSGRQAHIIYLNT